MLVPVVFLILPVTVMFALYPGLVAPDFPPRHSKCGGEWRAGRQREKVTTRVAL